MTQKKDSGSVELLKAELREDKGFLLPLTQPLVQEVLESEMEETVGARKGERTASRLGYRSGYYGRKLVTRVANPRVASASGPRRKLRHGGVRSLRT